MKKKLALGISIVTVVPMMALLAILGLYLKDFSFYQQEELWVIWCIVFLVIIPSSTYIFSNYLPKFKEKGRKWERNFAFLMGIIGQVIGFTGAWYFNSPQGVKTLFMVYLVAGVLLSFTNFIIGKKASGHACGVAGPITFMAFVFGPKVGLAFFLMPVIFWSRLKLQRHSVSELVLGTLIGIMATIISTSWSM